ncbi:class I SAM-dependent methyltransferase [Hanstruepera ponticola]|uniref:class I SAM-dependent methyltransferase n=1 Tax=Hanstruepera ponticola TaxID=2042995 RepID=UPI000CF02217|nr:class I SAM-dependent methyltransferase [Hanstruepera ponticola]
MIQTRINTNDKNIGQVSKNNPGWRGSGEPSLKSLINQSFHNIKANLLKGNVRFFLNYQIQVFANTKTFVFNKNKKIKICPCCKYSGPGFIATSNDKRITYHSRCPNCDSRSRHRGLSIVLNQHLENKKLNLLFFAPEKVILKILQSKKKNIKIKTTDYYSHDVDFPNQDIQELTFPDKSFDYILCNHVIEHVPKDDLAFKELSRILNNGGKAIITIPGDYHLYDTVEFKSTDRNGHFRHYGLDVIKKMQLYFDKVEVIDMGSACKPEFGVRKNDLAFICYNLSKQ